VNSKAGVGRPARSFKNRPNAPSPKPPIQVMRRIANAFMMDPAWTPCPVVAPRGGLRASCWRPVGKREITPTSHRFRFSLSASSFS
jgi:hypothetical protein